MTNTPLAIAALAQTAIDQIEDIAAGLARLSKEDLLPSDKARAMCAELDDIVTALVYCPADDTSAFDPCLACRKATAGSGLEFVCQ